MPKTSGPPGTHETHGAVPPERGKDARGQGADTRRVDLRGPFAGPDVNPPVEIALGGKRGRGRVALVDADLATMVRAYRWHVTSAGYVARREGSGARRMVLLHRRVLELRHGEYGWLGDHINGDKLDNRRQNLRVVDHAANAQNVRARGGASPHRGVYRNRQGRWCACVGLLGRTRYLGTFETELDAAQAAAEYRREHLSYSREAMA